MKKKIRYYIMILSILGIALTWSPIFGADWYVDRAADPDGDGTSWTQAFQTIQQAVNAVEGVWVICNAPPDTIHVRGGTYARFSPITINKYVTILGGYNYKGIRNLQSTPTIIDGQRLINRCLIVTRPCVIDGFTVRNAVHSGMDIDATPVYCSSSDFYHVPIIKNCTIEDNGTYYMGNYGGGIQDYQSNCQIKNCIFQRNMGGDGGGFRSLGYHYTFENCIFRENQAFNRGGAIDITNGYSGNDESLRITNCLFYRNQSEGVGGAIIAYHIPIMILNSTFFGNTAIIQGGAHYGDGPWAINTIFWGNSPDQLYVRDLSPPYAIAFSCIEDGWTGSSNIDDDPMFASSATDDFHLSLGSPCIDSGFDAGMPTDDLDGVLRPHDGRGDGTAEWDMGAYEFIRTTIPGDFDWDWDIDGSDLPGFGSGFGSQLGDPAYSASYDFDADGSVDENDLEILASGFGQVEVPQPVN